MKKLLPFLLCLLFAFALQVTYAKTDLGNWFYSESWQVYRPLAWHPVWNHATVSGADISTFVCSKNYAVCRDKNVIYYDEGGSSWTYWAIDKNAYMIDTYYSLIKQHKFQDAFSMRNTKISIDAFQKMYQSISNFVVYNIQLLSPNNYGFYVDTTDSAWKIQTYYVKKSFDSNGKITDISSVAQASVTPKEFTMKESSSFYFTKKQEKYTDVAPYSERMCNYRNDSQYKSYNIPSCTTYKAYKTVVGVEYGIYPKNLPSYVVYSLKNSLWGSVFVLPNVTKLSKKNLIGIIAEGVTSYEEVSVVNNKYVLLEGTCSSWAGETVWCKAISSKTKTLKK